MKTFFLILFIVFGLILSTHFEGSSKCANNLHTNNDTVKGEFKIENITSIKGAYIIDVSIEDYNYRIVSKKGSCRGTRIKSGNYYNLTLWPYFNKEPSVPYISMQFIVTIEGADLVVPSTTWSDNVYLTNDLIGKNLSQKVKTVK